MPEQHLDYAELNATFQKMRRKAVAQAMGRGGLAKSHFVTRDTTSVLQCGDGDVIAGLPTGKQP